MVGKWQEILFNLVHKYKYKGGHLIALSITPLREGELLVLEKTKVISLFSVSSSSAWLSSPLRFWFADQGRKDAMKNLNMTQQVEDIAW
jgi:hypothetical protein